MRHYKTLLVVPLLAALAACSSDMTDDGSNPPPAGDNTVTVSNNEFSPSSLSISAGEAVQFVWASGATNHNLLADVGNASSMPESPGAPTLLDAPQQFSVTFPSAGTFRYYCGAHGSNPSSGTVSGMSGSIIVGAM